MRALAVSLCTAVVLLVSGCSGEVTIGDPTVDREELEQQITTQLGESVGREPESISCPDDLRGEVGTEMRCTLQDSGTELGVTVVVTEVDGTDVRFSVEVDELDEAPSESPAS